MPEEETPKPKQATVTAEEEPIVDAVELNKPQKILESQGDGQAVREIQNRIDGAENILVALKNDPSVDEIAAAIGLTIALNKLGKRTTAIYSGATPNVLQFLEPEKTLDDNPDVLQDLIIALNKDKADHLRYKVDGDYVKIFVTPYKTKLVPEDLSYSYGDYNVDLVIALDVHTAMDLDAVLRKHGRIMHDASAINITTTVPGRFADVEWSDTTKSSVSEMAADLLLEMKKPELDAEIATPLLAGIVAATERFKNEHTGSETMRMAGRLMEAGANAQLVAENVSSDDIETGAPDDLNIEVDHSEELEPEPALMVEEPEPEPEVMPESLGPVDAPLLNEELMEELKRQQEEANAEPEPEPVPENAKDYGKMIDEALAELNGVTPTEPVMETATPAAEGAGVPNVPDVNASDVNAADASALGGTAGAETVAGESVMQSASDLPMPPSDGVLPPPPAPKVDFATGMPEMPESELAMDAPEMPTVDENVLAGNASSDAEVSNSTEASNGAELSGDALAGEVMAEMPITEAPAEAAAVAAAGAEMSGATVAPEVPEVSAVSDTAMGINAPVVEASVNNNPVDPSEFKIPGM